MDRFLVEAQTWFSWDRPKAFLSDPRSYAKCAARATEPRWFIEKARPDIKKTRIDVAVYFYCQLV
jgi:hypothetical protein